MCVLRHCSPRLVANWGRRLAASSGCHMAAGNQFRQGDEQHGHREQQQGLARARRQPCRRNRDAPHATTQQQGRASGEAVAKHLDPGPNEGYHPEQRGHKFEDEVEAQDQEEEAQQLQDEVDQLLRLLGTGQHLGQRDARLLQFVHLLGGLHQGADVFASVAAAVAAAALEGPVEESLAVQPWAPGGRVQHPCGGRPVEQQRLAPCFRADNAAAPHAHRVGERGEGVVVLHGQHCEVAARHFLEGHLEVAQPRQQPLWRGRVAAVQEFQLAAADGHALRQLGFREGPPILHAADELGREGEDSELHPRCNGFGAFERHPRVLVRSVEAAAVNLFAGPSHLVVVGVRLLLARRDGLNPLVHLHGPLQLGAVPDADAEFGVLQLPLCGGATDHVHQVRLVLLVQLVTGHVGQRDGTRAPEESPHLGLPSLVEPQQHGGENDHEEACHGR
mmetsp:Transcript_55737/g.146596  ORF Transcript_55737/g.146596 Transcript_55737/m.146596 type:complete len:447 (-) Transcript_55737:282-1622(-)